MAKEYIPLFLDFNETTQDLTDEECGRLVRAIVEYANGNDCEARLCGAEKIAFRFLKGVVDRNQAISDIRRQARQGKTQQKSTNDNKPEQNATNPQNKNNNKNNNKNKNENEKEGGETAKRFTPPTVDDVKAYCTERGNNIDPAYFVDYYAARDWRLTNGKRVADWRACVRTWERNNYGGGRKAPAQTYAQRDYTGEQEKALQRMMNDEW